MQLLSCLCGSELILLILMIDQQLLSCLCGSEQLDKLENFLDKGQPDFIDDEQWALLKEQQMHMDAYNDVLTKRIAKF